MFAAGDAGKAEGSSPQAGSVEREPGPHGSSREQQLQTLSRLLEQDWAYLWVGENVPACVLSTTVAAVCSTYLAAYRVHVCHCMYVATHCQMTDIKGEFT